MSSIKVKTIVSFILSALFVLTCVGCGDSSGNGTAPEGQTPSESAARSEKYSPDEYLLYQNIFYSGYGDDYNGKATEKEGVFAVLHDAYNDRDRYYVWGYYDATKCCDWQWEFVPGEGAELPAPGSLIRVTGTFVRDESALDKYWIRDAKVGTLTAYTGPTAYADMLAMSCTLERVQMYNIMTHPDAFRDKAFFAYGRIASADKIEDPYYDNSWNIGFSWSGALPAIGTLVELSGTVSDGALAAESMKNM